MVMRAKFINEKFEEESDPIKDMNIGGFTYSTLKPGAIIVPKRSMRFGKSTGKLVSRGGIPVSIFPKRPYIVISHASQIYQSKDMYLSGFMVPDLDTAMKYREKLRKEGRVSLHLQSWMNRLKICIKEKSFNNRFDIIERGFK
jgi:hypothetical protein